MGLSLVAVGGGCFRVKLNKSINWSNGLGKKATANYRYKQSHYIKKHLQTKHFSNVSSSIGANLLCSIFQFVNKVIKITCSPHIQDIVTPLLYKI